LVLLTSLPIELKSPPTLSVSTFVLDGLFLIQPLSPSTTIASHDIERPTIDSHVVMKAPSSLEVPSPSLAQVAMEFHRNILALPSTKILFDLPTPTPIEVLEPLLIEVLVPPSLFRH
jgi:hypothetical protein